MARQTGIITFTGKLGNLVGYCRHGIHFLRSQPEHVRQTAATRKAAAHFGTASTKGRLIRNAIIPHLNIAYEGTRVNRLNRTLIHAGKNNHWRLLEGFRFNKHAGLDKFFTQPPALSGNGRITIPVQILQSPTTATTLRLTLVSARIDFITRQVIATRTSSCVIDLRMPFKGASLDAHIPGPGSLLLTLQVQAFNEHTPMEGRLHMAADIIAVLIPQPPAITRKSAREKLINKRTSVLRRINVYNISSKHRTPQDRLTRQSPILATLAAPTPFNNSFRAWLRKPPA